MVEKTAPTTDTTARADDGLLEEVDEVLGSPAKGVSLVKRFVQSQGE